MCSQYIFQWNIFLGDNAAQQLNKNVTRSFAIFLPGAVFSLAATNVRSGKSRKNSPDSSVLYNCASVIPISSNTPRNLWMNGVIWVVSLERISPQTLRYRIPWRFLNFVTFLYLHWTNRACLDIIFRIRLLLLLSALDHSLDSFFAAELKTIHTHFSQYRHILVCVVY